MMFRQLWLLLWKNLFITRRRHWILTLIEILLPILLFLLVAYGRSKITGLNKTDIKEATYSEIVTQRSIENQLQVGELKLWYCPYTNFTEKIIRNVQLRFQIAGEDIQHFGSEEELLKHFTKNSSDVIVAITFKGNDPKKLNYDISIHDKYLIWETDKRFSPLIGEEEMDDSSKYLYKGFAAIQIAINTAFMEMWQSSKNTKINFNIQEFPYPPHTSDSGLNQLFIHFLPLITMFSFIFLCPAVLKRVGEEKYSGTKEFLKMVGVKSSTIWLGWFVHALSTNLLSIVAIVIMMKVPFGDVSYAPIEYCDGVVLFVFLFLFCMAAVTFCFLIGTIFDRPSIATLIGVLIWIFSYFIPQTLIDRDNVKWKYKVISALFPNVALQYGYSAIAVYEMREVGIQWNNLFQSGSGGENDITMGNVFIILIIDMLMFMILTLYIENIKPGEYGIARPLSFPFLNMRYRIKQCFTSRQVESVSINLLDKVEKGIYKVPCIEIKNLYKKYYKHVAVENLTMDIYKNCITVLLGHNGAGKTTTMSILTGMINATSGSVKVNGKDIKAHTEEVRKNMGLCPQHNLFFPDLTVTEHLQFFGMLRGMSIAEAKSAAMELLEKFGIPNEKKNDMAHTLSGGMKRKLCLGMALIGNPGVLILDEPTSGMDPESRREVWNLLLEYKKSTTILITTHFMEEADVLGDWIAIMANGRLQCYDTPMRLKNLYNTGYHLSLMLNSSACLEKITNEITFKIPEAFLLRQNGDNAVYILPLNKKPSYPELFKRLEERKEQLGIVTIGLSITTLNDVYLKAIDQIDGENKSKNQDKDFSASKDENDGNSCTRNSPILSPIASLVFKRWYFLKRKPYWYIPGIVVSIGIFLLTLWLGMANTDYYNYGGTQLNLNLSIYGKTAVLYGGFDDFSNPSVAEMKKIYHNVVLEEMGEPVQVEDISEGIIRKGIENIAYYKRHMIVAAEFNSSTINKNEIDVNAMYSRNAVHSIPISINLAMNAIVKTLLNDSFSITVSNKPLRSLYTDLSPSELSTLSVGILWLILIPTGMLFFMSNFIIFPNLEVSTNFIQIQLMAGVKIYVYWLINILFDYFVLCIPKLLITYFVVKLVDHLAFESTILGDAEYRALGIIFFSYTLASLPFMYLFSYRKTLSGGFTLLILLGMFLGITPTVVVRVLEISGDDCYMEIGKYIKHVLLCTCPQFALSYVCIKFAQKYVENFNWRYMNPNKKKFYCNSLPNPCCYGENTWECQNYKSYLNNKDLGVANALEEMMVSLIIYFIILCFLHSEKLKKVLLKLQLLYRFFKIKIENKEMNDKEEQEIIQYKGEAEQCNQEKENRLRVQDLEKSFGTKLIVKNLKLTLKKNECFGLLGVNGAGKSTTFRMLIKDILYEKGKITMSPSKKHSIDISDSEYSKNIGYCPQEDNLNYFLTGRELLRAIALIRGYSRSESNDISRKLLKWFDLEEYGEKLCLEYSGGNKRKLCACIAFLGCPQVILLDEPTSGVDPSSRRTFWNILSSYKKQKDTAILLCSHSMEECEALCDQIGIMKNGRISDEGSLLDLKNRHAKGYTVEMKLKNVNEKNSDNTHLLLIENSMILRNAELKNKYSDLLIYLVKNQNVTLSELFTEMEQLKNNQKEYIEDYTLTQTSLEDIFLSVAKEK